MKGEQRNGEGPCGNSELQTPAFFFSSIFFSFSDERYYSMFAGFVEITHRKRLILVRKGKTAEQISEKVRKDKGL